MKLLRYGPKGAERPGLLDELGRIRDLSGQIPDVGGDSLSPESLRRLGELDPESLPLVEGPQRLGPPVSSVGKILGVGLNYRAHAAETGAASGAEPLIFCKAVTAISGPTDPIVLPRGSRKTDWEVELGVVIGAHAQYVSPDRAMEHVAGYVALDDVSERAFQKERGGQFVKGKSHDSFAPLGPWLATRDEISDPQDLDLWLDVNGERRQSGNTRDMIFPIAFLISHLSEFMTLLPGDVIATGTPEGVGAGMKPPQFLKPGDVVVLGVKGLGQQRHEVVAFPDGD